MPTPLFYTDANLMLKGERAIPKKVQYANLQLLVGHHAFPQKEGTSEPITAPYAPSIVLIFKVFTFLS